MADKSIRLNVLSPDGEQQMRLDWQRDRGRTIADLLRHEGLPLNTRCGQKGLCNGCTVALKAGQVKSVHGEDRIAADGQPVEFLACEHTLAEGESELAVEIPSRSLLSHEPQVLTDFRINVPFAHDPLEPQAPGRLGIAIDIGTTTVVVVAVDRETSQVLARASDFNRQMHLGDDVLTRINLCMTNPEKIGEMRDAIVDATLKPLLAKVLDEVGATESDVACVTIAGNSTMLHLAMGVDPSSMGVAPFTPTFIEAQRTTGRELGLMDTDTIVHLLPGAAAYVGADLTAGALATGLAYDQGPNMLVDVGTNGEIILKYNDDVFGCATAAGPAFEGSGLKAGMRASTGAVSHVTIEGDRPALQIEVIGGGKPVGICGSAYLDLLGQGVAKGILNMAGRLNTAVVETHDVVFLKEAHYGLALRVGRGLGNEDIVITETDIASLLQAKGAIAAGILTLLRRSGLKQSDVKKLYLAGGFGMHLNIPNAILCGLLPGFDAEQIEVVGNTSLAGAYLALIDAGIMREMQNVGRKMEIVELNLDPEFEMTYIEQLML